MMISAALSLAIVSGCQETRLRERTLQQASTVTDLYYRQTLNNLAMMYENPGAIPYFSLPSQGTNTNQNAVNAMYNPTWDFITAKGAYIGRYLQDKNSATFGGSLQNAETWQTAPTTNPDKLHLLRCAYLMTIGHDPSPECADAWERFRAKYRSPFNYLDEFHPRPTPWYCVGGKHDVPKEACYVGRCGKTYVWVLPQNVEALSRFTLAILDLVTVQPKRGEVVLPLPEDLKTKLSAILKAKYNSVDELKKALDKLINDPKYAQFPEARMRLREFADKVINQPVTTYLKQPDQLKKMDKGIRDSLDREFIETQDSQLDEFIDKWSRDSEAEDRVLQDRAIPNTPIAPPPVAPAVAP
jgi:hypothetical protein